MEFIQTGMAGTMESGDIYVEIERGEPGRVSVELNSTVGREFGAQIERAIRATLADCALSGVFVRVVDKGALDCTIRARVSAAAYRCAGRDDFTWR